MAIGSEKGAVQNPFWKYAEDAGWKYIPPEQIDELRRGITSPVLDTILIDQLKKLNPDTIDQQRAEDTVEKIIRVKPNIEGNLTAWQYLKGLGFVAKLRSRLKTPPYPSDLHRDRITFWHTEFKHAIQHTERKFQLSLQPGIFTRQRPLTKDCFEAEHRVLD